MTHNMRNALTAVVAALTVGGCLTPTDDSAGKVQPDVGHLTTTIVEQHSEKAGLHPDQLQSAYPRLGSKERPLVVVVGIMGYPRYQSDLNTYNTEFGLTGVTITKYNQSGGSTAPSGFDLGFATASALGLQLAQSICAGDCDLSFVMSDSDGIEDGYAAQQQAESLTPDALITTFVADPSVGDGHTLSASVPHFAGAGTSGQFWWPANQAPVTAVAPTNLVMSNLTITSETATTEGGSGCTAFTKVTGEASNSICTNHATPTIGAVGSTNSPVSAVLPQSSSSSMWGTASGTVVSASVAAAQAAFNANLPLPDKFWAVQGNTSKLRAIPSGNFNLNIGNGAVKAGPI